MLIYLNRTGYNGLFRLNSRGAFNVPAGRYANPRRSATRTNLRRLVSARWRRPGCPLEGRARSRPRSARSDADDFVYLDPPYAPVSGTARFTSYTAGGFDADEQDRLQRAVVAARRRRARPSCSAIRSRPTSGGSTRDDADALGGRPAARTVPARRAINSRAAGRGAVREYLITNVR